MTLPPFDQVVCEHGPALLRLCYALCGPQEAEDVWSETFLAALAAYPTLESAANLRAWLATIARRKSIDRHRSAQRQPIPVASLAEAAAVDGHFCEQHDHRSSLERSGALRLALDALSERQRAAILYHYLIDLPYADVARLIGSSEGAARRAAADGIAALRRRLAEVPG
ncbi:MAG TPA: RNA polymerase sigma factor [Solirubrobacteraceae bacterium]|nr:RNA polymerase sigma factor [Solirubrobacteraceae bacterium]